MTSPLIPDLFACRKNYPSANKRPLPPIIRNTLPPPLGEETECLFYPNTR
ncbi:hypothetical protein POREN0001_0520 [Porphyromonas endodontalis ATCC 35406]|uniref:Uncharacterized protein n=1 Tax=Porphyromonas endodontalis (strain ATCC 35406 / DSM 24491 / JCM 8526 / CCUG 16442 / BCRC 14492 / NCTC 13058 / HG 370) TaxID=553175 RepID=C3J8K4_POREA|nr:hypothetical protein POREN0001_0520 [Porphyromonas endodontalis ATCC 35406]